MKKLSKDVFKRAENFIKNKGRKLEKARLNFLFNNCNSIDVVKELKKYQNADGGFGKGLEPDFTLPMSSPMATTIAFQIIDEINDQSAKELIHNGIRYFEQTFCIEGNGWYAVSKEVNNFPHAPWWHYNLEDGMTIIDKNWGNPSAEILGYLFKYQQLHTDIQIENLVNFALDYLMDKGEFNSEHEVYCFIRLYDKLSSDKKSIIDDKLTEAVQNLVCTKPEEWIDYTPQPVHFVSGPNCPMFGISEDDIVQNLDYLIDSINDKGFIEPNWEWGQYQKAWEKAKEQWTGILTLRSLKVLDNFNRIDK